VARPLHLHAFGKFTPSLSAPWPCQTKKTSSDTPVIDSHLIFRLQLDKLFRSTVAELSYTAGKARTSQLSVVALGSAAVDRTGTLNHDLKAMVNIARTQQR
jgi:hypothetical protein